MVQKSNRPQSGAAGALLDCGDSIPGGALATSSRSGANLPYFVLDHGDYENQPKDDERGEKA